MTVQASSPHHPTASAPPPTPPPTVEHARRANRRARRRTNRTELREVPTPMTHRPTPAQLRAQRNRARYLRLVDLRDPFAPSDPHARSRPTRRSYLVADLRDPFLLATRSPRPAWHKLPGLPGDIRNPFLHLPPRPNGNRACGREPQSSPDRTAGGIPIQRPRSIRERRNRTRCVDRRRQPAKIAGERPADLRDPFTAQARPRRR